MTRHTDEADPPRDFLAIKGRFTLNVTPQIPRGWLTGAAWTAAIILPYIPLGLWSASLEGTPRESWILAGVLPVMILTGLTIWAMIRWILARADIVSPGEVKDMIRDRRSRPDRKRG